MANGHGGQRQPERPAAVSNPQSGARTDGGAGSKSQPLRVASGGAYGQRQAAEAQQRGAPLAAGGSPAGQNPAGGGGGGAGAQPAGGGAFGPTQRPYESNTAGAGANPLLTDPNTTLRALYTQFPHPNIWRLIQTESDYR